ncbi:TPA: superantigen-like protein SSL5 [Staphylococcus aureus]
MKMTAIAKASLALGILATGTITSLHQTVNASEHKAKYENVTKDIFDLRDYYSGASKELKNVTGYRYSKGGKHYLIFDKNRKFTRVQIFGKDIEKYPQGEHDKQDAFLVIEEETVNGRQYSIGGLSKTNSKEFSKEVDVKVTRKIDESSEKSKDSKFKITKEEISLKELDFKLRKKLMEEEKLYGAVNNRKGKIVVKMEDDKFYTFELTKKLQPHRMGDTIDGTKIKEINVELEYK